MIEAGTAAYRLFDIADPAEWKVRAVFVAMIKEGGARLAGECK